MMAIGSLILGVMGVSIGINRWFYPNGYDTFKIQASAAFAVIGGLLCLLYAGILATRILRKRK